MSDTAPDAPQSSDPLPEPEPEPPRWPFHQRVLGVAGRAGFATLGLLPIVLFALGTRDFRARTMREMALVLGVMLGASAVILALEWRGGRWWVTPLRLAGAGAACFIVLPLPLFWLFVLIETGDPTMFYDRLLSEMRVEAVAGVFVGAGISIFVVPMLGLLLYVRNKTERLFPQAAAGVLMLIWPAVLLLADGSSRDRTFGMLMIVTGLAVPLSLALGDRVMRRWDPQCPRPDPTGDARLAFAVSAPFVILLPALILGNQGFYGHDWQEWGDWPAYRTLSRMPNIQGQYRARNRRHAPRAPAGGTAKPKPTPKPLEPAAASFSELADNYSIDRALAQGVKHGYVYRLTGCTTGPGRWAAAADPLRPEFGNRHFFVNHTGIAKESDAPIPLDPSTCDAPAGTRDWSGE